MTTKTSRTKPNPGPADNGLNINYRRCRDLKPSRRNPRTHSKQQISQIANSIKEFGFTNPVLIDQHDMVIAGHGRLAAAKRLGLKQVPTIRLDQLSDDQIRA